MYLKMNEPNGNNLYGDCSFTRATITPNGGVAGSNTQGKYFSTSAYFDGNGDYLTLPDNGNYELGTNNFFIGVWIYITDSTLADINTIFGQSNASGYSPVVLYIFTDRTLYLGASSTGSSWLIGSQSTATVGVNGWHYISVRRVSTAFNVYLDGSSVISATKSESLNNSSGNFTIGYERPTYPRYFKGYMQDLRFHNSCIIDGTVVPKRSLV
jgi:hypothetical protein